MRARLDLAEDAAEHLRKQSDDLNVPLGAIENALRDLRALLAEPRPRTFDHFNASGDPCVICGTHDDKETILVPYENIGDGIARAIQVHLECYQRCCAEAPVYFPGIDIFAVPAKDE